MNIELYTSLKDPNSSGTSPKPGTSLHNFMMALTSADNDNSKAELFIHYLYSDSSIPVLSHDDLPLPDNPLNSIHFTVEVVFDALTELNPHKASGIDIIPPTVLKHCTQTLTVLIYTSPLYKQFYQGINTYRMENTQDCPSI